MTLTEDLAKLKELDPATYRTYIDGAAIHGVLLAEKGGDPLQMAWLQWCLQEAIRREKLFLYLGQISPGPRGVEYRATIKRPRIYVTGENRPYGEDPFPEIACEYGITPAEAILAAYIAALEAQG